MNMERTPKPDSALFRYFRIAALLFDGPVERNPASINLVLR
jgi:hypothetical protein